ncbi:MAG TPA: glycosyltransferase [Chitinophagaceae bacterium]|nr:glycosyltransferase [Chitinophagaceae bacterium]
MNLSVIIPAYNASLTIADTIDSLIAQTSGSWEIVIVDDGSTDGTASVAHRYCDIEPRISLVRQSNGGLSAARNTGIAAAKYEYLLFLDADDWIAPNYIERFKSVFEEDPGIDAVVCGWHFTLEDGTVADSRFPPDVEDMFPYFSHTCPFVVHACVINRKLIENAGVFDSKVGYVEDWDFWQRVSRTGARFKLIRETLAYYRMRKGSLSRKVYQSYEDAGRMIAQGYSEDKRVVYPVEKYQYGMPDAKEKEYQAWLYCWYAGLCLGVEEKPAGLARPDLKGFIPDPVQLAAFIFEGVYRGGCFLPADWYRFYELHQDSINSFFSLLENESGHSSVIRDSKLELFSLIVRQLDQDLPMLIGEVLYQPIEVTNMLNDLSTTAAKLIMDVKLEGSRLGKLELWPEKGMLPEYRIRQAISDQWAWNIMTCYLRHRKGIEEDMEGNRAWELFLQEFWGLDWPEPAFYDVSYVDNGQYEVRAWEALIRVEASADLFHVRSENKVVEIWYYIGGFLAGKVKVEAVPGLISAQAIRAAISADGKFDLCRIAVYQGLIGKNLDKILLRNELRGLALMAK